METENNKNETLLGVIINRDLKFDARIKSLCRKATQKLISLSRINKYFTYEQYLLLVNSVLKPTLPIVLGFQCFAHRS